MDRRKEERSDYLVPMSEDSKVQIETSVAFDESKQLAFLGWTLRDPAFFVQASKIVRPDWFVDIFARKAFKAALEIQREYHRGPEANEIHLWRGLTGEDSKVRSRIEQIVAKSLDTSKSYGLDIIKKDMQNWLDATKFVETVVQKAVPAFNNKNLARAWELLEKGMLDKKTSTFESGTYQGFTSSSENMAKERTERKRHMGRLLEYGHTYLDDALYGIRPTELILLGAKSGSGKTQMCLSIALHNAQKGKRVHMFALEADQYEIERRIKFGILSNYYYAQGNHGHIDQGSWISGEIADITDPLEDELEQTFADSVKNLQMLYRTSGTFDVQAMEQELLALVGKTDLIILDHLHYIDTGDEEENVAYARVVKAIRDIVLRYEIPVILVAHLRKDAVSKGKSKIVPALEDFHGSSNVVKIATTAIMLGRAHSQEPSMPGFYMQPTFIKITKCRLDGQRTYLVALSEFNTRTNTYEPVYKLGKPMEQDTEWEQLPYLLPWQKRLARILNVDIGG